VHAGRLTGGPDAHTSRGGAFSPARGDVDRGGAWPAGGDLRQALEVTAQAGLGIGSAELDTAERSARTLIAVTQEVHRRLLGSP
jgi:hypothetical protein